MTIAPDFQERRIERKPEKPVHSKHPSKASEWSDNHYDKTKKAPE